MKSTDSLQENPSCACAFTGHRILSAAQIRYASDLLYRLIPRMSEKGITTFYAGGALGFDTLAEQILLDLRDRQKLPLRLILAIPCKNQCQNWRTEDQQVYQKILRKADTVCLLSENYYDGCMQRRNRFMVDHSMTLVAFMIPHRPGGTSGTVRYALQNGRKVINLFDYLPTPSI